jgi:hypothetical protein
LSSRFNMETNKYKVLFRSWPPEMWGLWEGSAWFNIPVLEIDHYRPESSRHRPQTGCKMFYDQERLYGIFRVADQYVRCTHNGFQAEVYKDSCVEFFVQPQTASGYFNFEFNCGGALLASYITDPTRIHGRVGKYVPLTPEDDRAIYRYSSLPSITEPEITEKIVWLLEFSIPFALLEKYTEPLGEVAGQTWKANFYKCGNETSHQHWGSWSPVDELNFHAPANFGTLKLERSR